MLRVKKKNKKKTLRWPSDILSTKHMEIITQKVFNIRLHRDKERNERASFHNFVIYSSLAPQDLLILLVLTYISYLT